MRILLVLADDAAAHAAPLAHASVFYLEAGLVRTTENFPC
jgi:hypothetical protein